MVRTKDILVDYKEAGRHKLRNPEFVAYDLHRYSNLSKLCSAINDRNLQPKAAAYIVRLPVYREVWSAEIAQCIVEHHEERYLRPLIENVINDNVFNNRKGKGLDGALNHLIEDIYDVSNGLDNHSDCYVAVTDITGYFPNADQDRSYRILEKLLLESSIPDDIKNDLLYLLRISIYIFPENAERRSPISEWDNIPSNKSLFSRPPGKGAAAGRVIMQMAMTYYHDEVVKWIVSNGVHVTVYGDDMAFVFRNKEHFLRYFMPEYRRRMEDIGCTIHPRKFYCQHFTKGVIFCSQVIKMQRLYAGNRCVNNFNEKIKYWNQRVSILNIQPMLASINSYIGILKNRCGYGILRRGVSSLDDRWMKYVTLDDERNTLVAREGYRYNDIIRIINHLKNKNHGKRRKRKSYRSSPVTYTGEKKVSQ